MSSTPVEVTLEIPMRAELLERCYPNGKVGGVTLDGKPPGPLGQWVVLTVLVAKPAERHFTVRGQLSWARHKGSAALKACYGVDFLPDDAAGRGRLLAFANGEVDPQATRYETRAFTELPVTLRSAGKVRKQSLADLSPGGAFVRTDAPLEVGAAVSLELRPPRALTRLRLKGRVVWTRRVGEAPGMGMIFEGLSFKQGERLRALVDRLSASGRG